MKKLIGSSMAIGIVAVAAIISFSGMFTVNSGHVAVGTLYGKVQDTVYTEGMHWENPLMNMKHFDVREKTLKLTLAVPSADQLSTSFDISIQFRLLGDMVPTMIRDTGTPEMVIDTHMMPLFSSKTREIGKSVENAESFYKQEVQQRVQNELLTELSMLSKKGIKIEKLLVRKVTLPKIITDAVLRKKTAAQNAEKAKEELKKFKVDQERKNAEAQASRLALVTKASGRLEAAKIDAKATLITATAEAQSKKKQIDVLGRQGYITLETVKTLKYLENGNHYIITDGKNGSPIPFMNMTKMVK